MAHPLAGHFSVEESAKRVRHYRYAEERMMRLLGGWIALTPELGAKLLLGRHVWDCAQHADLWGRRLPELRAPAQASEPPNEAFVRFMDQLESPEGFHRTPERLVGVYRVLKPHLLATYERHLALANPVYEPPTRRILQRTVEDERRHIAAGRAILAHHLGDAGTRRRAEQWEARLRALLAEAGGVAGEGLAHLGEPEVPPDPQGVAQDLVELERPIGRWPLPPDLEAVLDSHAASLAGGHLERAALHLAPECREQALALYRSLEMGAPVRHAVVGVARLGGQRFVKLRLEGPDRTAVLLGRWAQREGGWRLVELELVRTDPASA